MIDPEGIAEDLLARMVAAVDSPPSRQYISAGRPVHDCEQIVVWVTNIDPSNTLPTPNRGKVGKHTANSVSVCGELVRCLPVPKKNGSPPTAAELDAAGRLAMADAAGIYTAVLEPWGDCTIFSFSGVSVGAIIGRGEGGQGGLLPIAACLTVST